MNGGGRLTVAFDLSTAAHAVGGVSRYLLSLAGALSRVAADNGVDFSTVDVPATHPGVEGPPADLVLRDPAYLRLPVLRRMPIRRGWEPTSRAARLGRLAGCTRVFHHGGVQPFAPPGSISVITMYDLSALEHPEWHTPETVEYARREERMIAAGSLVASISNWTALEAVKRFSLEPGSVGVIGGAADELFSPGRPSERVMTRLGLVPGGYLLHVGNYVPRKNIPFLIAAYLRSRERGLRLPLILVGAGAWGNVKVAESEGVTVLTGLDDASLVEVYRGARAVLVPSECEGLGLPVLEALACGTPVVASNAGALPETLGNHGVLLDPHDGSAWSAALSGMEDPDRYLSLRDMAITANRPSWDDCAVRLCGFYREVAGS